MRKRRKVLVILGLIALAAVCFVTLKPRDEPKYQGRYLSEWIATYHSARYRTGLAHDGSNPKQSEWEAAEHAIEAIGTNSLPYLIRWMRYETPVWRIALHNRLPSWATPNDSVSWAIYGEASRNAAYAPDGIEILGTNAVSIIPELEAMMKDRSKPMTQARSIYALASVGGQAVPTLGTALADTNQVGRGQIVYVLGALARNGYSSNCLPLIQAAAEDRDLSVRNTATDALRKIAPELLTNTPGYSSSAPSQ